MNGIVSVRGRAGDFSLYNMISICFARSRVEAHTCAVQKQGRSGAALAIDRGYHSPGIDMSHYVLCCENRLDVVVLAGKAAAQVGCGFGDGQIIGGKARLRYDEPFVGWAALDLVLDTLLQSLRADNVYVGVLCVQPVSISMRS